jgi:NADH dehydrogenase [ubiquinone] 1 alpha subcomplex assembly factor 5
VVASGGPVNPHAVGPFRVFDREAKVMQKDRSASLEDGARSRTVDYVREEVADRLLERLMVRRSTHPIAYN